MNFLSAGSLGRLLQGVADLVPLFVDRGDRKAGRNAQAHQCGLGELQARFDRLRYGVGGAKAVKVTSVTLVSRARDDENVGPDRAHVLDDIVDDAR